ncbi:MAG TPA: flagellar biosynthesis anti-sigma factor FlgM [Gammaproteobacteria bacterium]|nr:flagellar biosynthesis anti-sigma factor FlgM [Gammaproteobacteria bacterium]MEC8009178.1 flagellar biosynthesis anti-sigma factor FlgM [Pseudomonadota bacterium]HBF08388.1 flagellar biosynthesis anti-sigma factor FlgM [Gammaproteobacteria bacterium]HCK91618.1 flagellar biosynthesis anti-sigma factor FlgM [Gammaproteobacteria bacterium]|tara:strand:- start:380 stop:682 length:303 start_codon:yes stop_codon:yes gene_type:complete
MNRIDSNQLNQLQAQAKKTNNTQKTATDGSQSSANTESAAASSDTVQISDTGRQLNEMEKSIDIQAFDQERVSAVRQSIQDGTYEADTMSIAEKMVNFDN